MNYTEYEYLRLVDLLGKIYSDRANTAEINELMVWLRDKREENRLKTEMALRKNKARRNPEPPQETK